MNEENKQNLQEPQNQTIQPVDASTRPHVTETPQKALRTYESDVADVLAHKNISTAKIALAEQKRQTGENSLGSSGENADSEGADRHSAKKMLMLGGAIVLLGIGSAGAYYLYSQSPLATAPQTTTNQQSAPVSIVPTDSSVVISIDGMTPNKILETVRAEMIKPTQPNTIKEIIFSSAAGANNSQRIRVNGPAIAKIMDISAPDILTRALANQWMLGIYTDGAGSKDAFVILTNNYFQNSFAGMLQWESTMADDIKQYLNKSASSYDAGYEILRGSFTDRIIRNKDVREFISSDSNDQNVAENKILFLYSFIDNSKLIVTNKESTLEAIIDRLEQKAFVR